mmetsp:Transcript_40353/g.67040  ORF Transcript_40353/g.67040 Transcript_40353/m.67040 type:complete len:263 (+) Transcript_40353:110-898(+)
MDCSGRLLINGQTAGMCLHPSGELISDVIRRGNIWDANTCRAAVRLANGGTIWDIGANIGALSLCIMMLHSGKLHSVEAVPWNFSLLSTTRTMNLNAYGSRWTIYKAALDSEKNNEAIFHGSRNNFGGTTAVMAKHHPHYYRGWGKKPQQVATIKTNTLDSLMSQTCAKVLKIDVEGFERFVMDGFSHHMVDPILRPCHIVMEWHIILLNAAGVARNISNNANELEKKLKGWGYHTSLSTRLRHDMITWSIRSANAQCCERG